MRISRFAQERISICRVIIHLKSLVKEIVCFVGPYPIFIIEQAVSAWWVPEPDCAPKRPSPRQAAPLPAAAFLPARHIPF
jgi:hypothetical protein